MRNIASKYNVFHCTEHYNVFEIYMKCKYTDSRSFWNMQQYTWHVVITNSVQIKSPKEKYETGAEQTWTPKKLEVGLGAVEEKIPFYIV